MRDPMMDARNEVHLTITNNGHCLSTDCWCEPDRIYWYKNKQGVMILVVEHNDMTMEHRNVVIVKRDRDLALTYIETSNSPWITRALEVVKPPPPLYGGFDAPQPPMYPFR